MRPSDYYQDLIASITDDDVKRVAYQLNQHVGAENMISIEALAAQAFGKATQSSIRKTREIIERLVKDYGMPVGAYSGKAGRFIIATEDERRIVAAEITSRISELSARKSAIQSARLPGQPMQQGSLFQ